MSESAIAQAGKPEVQGGTPVVEALLGFVTLALACFAATWCPDGLGRDLAWFVFVGAWAVLAAFVPTIFPAKGSRTAFALGGIFFLCLFCFALLLLGWMESSGGQQSFLISAILVVVATVLTRILVSRFLTRKGVAGLEEQGWTSLSSYKRVQGQRVRRLTMITLIITAVTGAMTLINAGYGARWFAELPFTGKVEITDPQNGRYSNPPLKSGDTFSREDFQRLQADLKNKVLVGGEAVTAAIDGGPESTYRPGDLIPREVATKVKNALRDGRRDGDNQDLTTTDAVLPETRKIDQLGLMLLPGGQLKVVALSLLGFYLVWRLVNVPAFADFLIATDSEMSKVSWPPFKKLWRDTLVVVAGMFLMGGMIMAIDWVWRGVLTSISVLQFPATPDDKNRSEDLKPWPAARETAAAAATAEQKK
jgi:preprotein translocase SecE subunit